jgi:hypothetical protein
VQALALKIRGTAASLERAPPFFHAFFMLWDGISMNSSGVL